MSSQFLEQQTICISAVPGALAHLLGAMINHAANPASALPNWSDDATIDNWPSQAAWDVFEDLAADMDLASLKNLIQKSSLTTNSDTQQVIFSRVLDPASLTELFPNSRCIQITVDQQDADQIGYNALFHECYPKKNYSRTSQAIANAAGFLNVSGNWQDIDSLLEEPMHRDNIMIKCASIGVGVMSVKACAAHDSAAARVVPYRKLYPYWKYDRTAAAQELVALLDWLDIEANPADMAQIWQQMLPKINHIQAYK